MQTALSSTFTGLNQEKAASQDAWAILKNLLDGGIIMALTTTIVGGALGYGARLFRQIYVGRLIEQTHSNMNNDVLEILKDIRDSLKKLESNL